VIAVILTALLALCGWQKALGYRHKLIIRSDPEGAAVFLSGRLIGETPLQHTLLDPRPVGIRLVLQGHEDLEDVLRPSGRPEGSFHWRPRTVEEEVLFRMRPLGESRLMVTSDPSGCEIVLDGRRLGKTPLNIGGLLPGHGRIYATHPGFSSASKDIELQVGEELSVHLELEDTVAALYESLIREDPANLNHCAELAHHYVLLGKFNKASDVLRAAYDALPNGERESVERFIGEVRRIYTRFFIYPEETEGNRIRPVCREIVERAMKDSLASERTMRSALQHMDRYDRDHGPKGE
jgi:hypothetical protein